MSFGLCWLYRLSDYFQQPLELPGHKLGKTSEKFIKLENKAFPNPNGGAIASHNNPVNEKDLFTYQSGDDAFLS